MTVRYPQAPCGCTVEVYDRFKPVCRMNCEDGARLLGELVGELNAGRELQADLVSRYNAHSESAIGSVNRPMATHELE